MKIKHIRIGGVFLIFTLFASLVYSSVPNKMTYQVVIRDQNNSLVCNQLIGMKVSILQWADNGVAVYIEEHRPTTNDNGLASIEIGTGIPIAGNFSTIDWSDGPYFIKSEFDITGGQSYTIVGTQELLSIPYAFYAKSAESIVGSINETDPLFHLHVASSISSYNLSYWNQKQDPLTAGTGILIANDTISSDLVAGHGIVIRGDTIEASAGIPQGSALGEMLYWDGNNWVDVPPGTDQQMLIMYHGVPTWVTTAGVTFLLPHQPAVDVLNSFTGKYWMDRNLGASQVATSSTDTDAYGDLYQWGRARDGHERRTSNTYNMLSTSDTPGHWFFIISPSTPYDWRSSQNDSLWQGVNGINNPCPTGYRLPTEAEWDSERLSWGSNNNSVGAFNSPLKLPAAGKRNGTTGDNEEVGNHGCYWSSTPFNVTFARSLLFFAQNAAIVYNSRSHGLSVRCIKN